MVRTKLFSVREYSEQFKVTPQTVRNWIREGYITAIKTPGGQIRIRAESNLREPEEIRADRDYRNILIEKAIRRKGRALSQLEIGLINRKVERYRKAKNENA